MQDSAHRIAASFQSWNCGRHTNAVAASGARVESSCQPTGSNGKREVPSSGSKVSQRSSGLGFVSSIVES
eukprot:198010-Amphidinium_carterae.1